MWPIYGIYASLHLFKGYSSANYPGVSSSSFVAIYCFWQFWNQPELTLSQHFWLGPYAITVHDMCRRGQLPMWYSKSLNLDKDRDIENEKMTKSIENTATKSNPRYFWPSKHPKTHMREVKTQCWGWVQYIWTGSKSSRNLPFHQFSLDCNCQTRVRIYFN